MNKTSSRNFKSELIAQLDSIAAKLPGVVIVNDITDGRVVWMSEIGLRLLEISLDKITSLSASEYNARFFNEDDARDYVPSILGLLERNNDDEFITFFQQVRIGEHSEWAWYMSSTRIFLRDEEMQPLLIITLSFPIDAMHHMNNKAKRLLEENNFLRKNFQKYSALSKRECEILRQLALGKSSSETASALFISLGTVDTHRKNIRKKLETSSYYELCQYARSFDLI